MVDSCWCPCDRFSAWVGAVVGVSCVGTSRREEGRPFRPAIDSFRAERYFPPPAGHMIEYYDSIGTDSSTVVPCVLLYCNVCLCRDIKLDISALILYCTVSI